jgi:hypothetical protein
MTAPEERVLRLVAWTPDDPPPPGVVDDIAGEFLLDEVLGQAGQDLRDRLIQAELDELVEMGLMEVDESGGYWVTDAGRAALDEPSDDSPGPVWLVTLERPGPGLPWVIDEIAEVTEITGEAAPAIEAELAAPARGAGRP